MPATGPSWWRGISRRAASTTRSLLTAMGEVPREAFVPEPLAGIRL